jgi:hypothetical protein
MRVLLIPLCLSPFPLIAVIALAGAMFGNGADKCASGEVAAGTTAGSFQRPAPRAEIAAPVHNFGVMSVGETRIHEFTIRNEGNAPLQLRNGRTTCKCTLARPHREEVLPGDSATVALEWSPVKPAKEFQQFVAIATNDPTQPTVKLTVRGRVEPLFILQPGETWQIGELSSDQPMIVTGRLFSAVLDDVRITTIESSHPLLEATGVPLSPQELAALQARSGYMIRLAIAPGFPVGPVREALTVHTNICDAGELRVHVEGTRSVPIRIWGRHWSGDDRVVHLGRFEARRGKLEAVSLLVDTLELSSDFEIMRIEVDHNYLKVSAARDLNFESRRKMRFELTVEVPPGAPANNRRMPNAVPVKLITNDDEYREIELAVAFLSF